MSRTGAEAPPGLTERTIRGAAWALPTSLGSRLVGLVGTLLLARYLAPSEYGEVSAAAILVATASTMTGFGVGIYLVANRDLSRAEAFHASCLFLVTGVVGIGAVWALAEPLAAWTDAPRLGRFMPIFVLSAMLERIAYLPERMMVREIRFRWLSLARASSELAYTGVSLGLAALGLGAMAIAWGNLARAALRCCATMPGVAWREWLEPHRLRLATAGKIVRYGVNVQLTFIATFAMSRWDNLLVSRYFGPGTMGAYNYAYNLADAPAQAIGEQMGDVVGASFPHVGGEKRAVALVRSFTMVSLVMLPLAFGLGAVAPTVVETFFDRRWADVGTMLAFLAVLSATRPMAQIVIAHHYAGHRPAVVLLLEWLSVAAIVVGISTVGRVGIRWTCGSVGAVFVLRTLAALWTVRRLDGVPLSSFLLPLARPLVVCTLMAAAIGLLRPALGGVSPAVRLAVEVALGTAVYLAGALLLFRSAAREFLGLVASALFRR
jgi:PST family polysaccharide transporter